MSEYYLVLSTVADEKEAKNIGSRLVEDKLAACVNIIPNLTSIYRWEDKVENSEEILILIKTTKEKLKKLISTIEDLHSYDVPEVIAIPIEEGKKDYLNWISENVD